MRAVPIPIRSADAEPDDTLDYMPMPREMNTFEMPRVPDPGPGTDVAGARDVLEAFVAHLDRWLAEGGDAPAVDLAGLAPDALRVLNETLGEGEVAAIVDAAQSIRIQETVFCGVWREQHVVQGRVVHDYLLAAPVPPVVVQRAAEHASAQLRELPLPAGAMNVPALLHELQHAVDCSAPGVPAHVINLSLLPLSPEDNAHLDALLDGGSVVLLSRGFGNCRISSTAVRNVWRVQYFNNMQTLILNTVEVVDVPAVAVASREDLVEARARLDELVQWMSDSIAAA
ncbi:hydrogenase expression/formation protein [Azohydromonas sediminis]|uniref:hydrogenase expression/formation protein n=1 Tax=Azohydromonas sediminis TaxID=2259674 RepID=UPI0013C3432B|nr:hydrogenase expression/formation protein [Azohydromonas sediminis]